MTRISTLLKHAVACALASTIASAQTTWYVNLNASPVGANGSQQNPYIDIQTAINAPTTVDGDSIEVAGGSYAGFSFGTKLIRVYGVLSSDGDYLVDISGGANSSCVSFPGPVTGSQTLEDLQLIAGTAAATTQGTTETFGGGIDVVQSQPTIRNVYISLCSAMNGAGISFRDSEGTVEDCVITGNSLTSKLGINRGGGVYLSQSGVTFRDCQIANNSLSTSPSTPPIPVTWEGGGVWISGNSSQGARNRFIDCDINGNLGNLGGGLYIEQEATPLFMRCLIESNEAWTAPSLGSGGGAYIMRSCPEFESCVISNNHAGAFGGGFYFGIGVLGGTSTTQCGTSLLSNCTIAYNEAGWSTGTVLPGSGGGIYIESASVSLERSILALNTVVTLAGNTPEGPQASLLNGSAIAEPMLTGNSLALGASTPLPFFDPGVPSSSFQVLVSGAPGFLAGTTVLDGNSPLVDALTTGYIPPVNGRDVDGQPRLVGTAVDYGADEFMDCSSSTEYGNPLPNSTGNATRLWSSGSQSLSANGLSLNITSGPPNEFGIFFYGNRQVSFPSYSGLVLAGGGVRRIAQSLTLDGTGNGSLLLDLSRPVFSRIVEDSNWNFQFWHRDTVNGSPTLNYSNGLNLYFCE